MACSDWVISPAMFDNDSGLRPSGDRPQVLIGADIRAEIRTPTITVYLRITVFDLRFPESKVDNQVIAA